MDSGFVASSIAPAAIILAAGFSHRLKSIGSKPFLFYKGKRFIEIIFEHAKTVGLAPIIAVTNNQNHQALLDLHLEIQIAINPQPEWGMLSSLIMGMKELIAINSSFFLCPIDYPLVQENTFHKLFLTHQSFPERIIKPVFKMQSGHPIVLPARLFAELEQAPLKEGVRFVTQKYGHLNYFLEVDDPGILININTPELYYQHCK